MNLNLIHRYVLGDMFLVLDFEGSQLFPFLRLLSSAYPAAVSFAGGLGRRLATIARIMPPTRKSQKTASVPQTTISAPQTNITVLNKAVPDPSPR